MTYNPDYKLHKQGERKTQGKLRSGFAKSQQIHNHLRLFEKILQNDIDAVTLEVQRSFINKTTS